MPNKKYKFRVCAINEAGNSEWSDGSELIEAKNPEIEPTIDESMLPREVNAVAGEDFKIIIPFKGGPVHKAQFSKVWKLDTGKNANLKSKTNFFIRSNLLISFPILHSHLNPDIHVMAMIYLQNYLLALSIKTMERFSSALSQFELFMVL